MAKLVTEFIGTFFLVLIIGLSVLSGSAYAPLAIGAGLMVLVYMGGHVSGAHYNPAVTLAIALRKKMPMADIGPYIAAQVVGAIVAALAIRAIAGKSLPFAPGEGVDALSALLVEVLFTFLLALVVLNVAVSDRTKGNSYYGAAIGFTVAAAATAGGGISGGAFNPAVGLGPTIVHALAGGGSWSHLWLYIVGPLAGGATAAAVFGLQERA
jgi:aquaporin Z